MKYFGSNVYRSGDFIRTFSLIGLAWLWCTQIFAADYTDGDIHKNDYKWFQFNIMQSMDNKLPFGNEKDTYLEMEFGGRNGIISLYGYLDVFDILDRKSDDLHKKDNFYLKLAPRFSLDGMLNSDFSFGSVKELYISTLMNVGDKGYSCKDADGNCDSDGTAANGLFETFIGLGADIELPWFGVIGSNVLARYARESGGHEEERKWSGYIWTTNWFKPFYFFEDKSFIAYQGYLDYKFKYDELAKNEDGPTRTSHSLEWFNGFYWHSDQWSLGYGLKYYNHMANFKDGVEYAPGMKQNTTGVGHYFAATYKF